MPPREPTKTSSGRTFQRKGLDSSPTRLAFSFYSIPYYSIQETEEALLFVHEQSVSHPALTCSLNSASSVPCGDMRQKQRSRRICATAPNSPPFGSSLFNKALVVAS